MEHEAREVAELTISVDRSGRICESRGEDKVPRLDMRGSAVAKTCVPNMITASAISTSCLRTEQSMQDIGAKTDAISPDLI